MTQNSLTSPTDAISLYEAYKRKGTISNCFLLPDGLANLAEQGQLSYCKDEENLYLFVQQPKCLRLYYFINNLTKVPLLEVSQPLATELLFRGAVPDGEENFLLRVGFKRNVVRDQYLMKFTEDIQWPSDVTIAEDLEEVKAAANLFNGAFDPYSGDYIPETDYSRLLEDKSILVVKDGDKVVGAIHCEEASKQFWIRHVCVAPDQQGKGFGNKLVSAYLACGHGKGLQRFALWVQRQNTPAVKLYEKYGFKFTNKSSLSLIRQ